ncbi:MAG: GntR family transcriptional regulator [Oscillospiraceae bacterium]|nr:GntR family transcriptional regulator [Oscillospiraceae bacterium]
MISLNYRDSRPIYEQIKDGLRRMIAAGVMEAHEKLPSVRALATELTINPNTIQRAYAELEKEGFIYSVAGKGSFVAESGGQNDARKQELFAQLRAISAELKLLGVTEQELSDLVRGGNEK